jgi:16S rRNA (cytosine1402-N4)-methyltransferase
MGYGNFVMYYHEPVLWEAAVEAVFVRSDGVYLDATIGGGGHACALLSRLGPKGRLIGIDQDVDALRAARQRLARFGKRVHLLHGNFADVDILLQQLGVEFLDGVLADLGVSSYFLDSPERGFSFRVPGPLDMRMDRSRPLTAELVVNTYSLHELERLIRRYGEEPRARRIARSIVAKRPLRDTMQLRHAIEAVVPEPERLQTLARVFQAIRIEVNDELGALERFLVSIAHWVRPGGRLVVLSYHSLEDRLVKRLMRYGNPEGRPIRDLKGVLRRPWRMLTEKPVRPDPLEVARNPRARSARMRVAERLEDSP